MQINNNVSAFNAYRNLTNTSKTLNSTMQKLSSGKRINSAADDAAGLTISTKLAAQLSSLSQANNNTQDAVSVTQIADGSLNEVASNLQRMRELSVQAANTGANDPTARAAIQAEITQLGQSIDQIGTSTSFGSNQLFTATASSFQVGSGVTDVVNVTVGALSSASLGVATVTVTTGAGASSAIGAIDAAIDSVNSQRANLGATQNSLESTSRNLSTQIGNVQDSNSRMSDTDYALESMNLMKASIQQQAGLAMMAQANSSSSSILGLLN